MVTIQFAFCIKKINKKERIELEKQMIIKISGIADVTKLAQEAHCVDGDIYVKKGVYCIDGKSLMGLFSIDMSGGATIIYPSDAIEFENYIKQFEVK